MIITIFDTTRSSDSWYHLIVMGHQQQGKPKYTKFQSDKQPSRASHSACDIELNVDFHYRLQTTDVSIA